MNVIHGLVHTIWTVCKRSQAWGIHIQIYMITGCRDFPCIHHNDGTQIDREVYKIHDRDAWDFTVCAYIIVTQNVCIIPVSYGTAQYPYDHANPFIKHEHLVHVGILGLKKRKNCVKLSHNTVRIILTGFKGCHEMIFFLWENIHVLSKMENTPL